MLSKLWVKRHSVNVNIAYKEFNDWEDILIIGRDISQEDLIVMVMARKGSVSYISTLDSIPSKIEKHFENNSKILVYPKTA
jgi:hypothetical protein